MRESLLALPSGYNKIAMISRLLSHVFFVLGVAMFGVAGYLYFAPAPASCLEVAESAKDVSDNIPGKKTPVVFHFHNSSSRPIRILGLNQC